MIVVFDFDKTLTYSDTLFGFYKEFSKNPLKFVFLILCGLLNRFGIFTNDTCKKFGIFLFIRGKSKDEVLDVGRKYIEKIKFREEIFQKVREYIENGDRVFIVSASYEEYLINLKKIFGPNISIFGSKLKFTDGKVSGLQMNCFGERKVEVLKNIDVLSVDIFYTDSIYDKPLMEISKKVCIVKGNSRSI